MSRPATMIRQPRSAPKKKPRKKNSSAIGAITQTNTAAATSAAVLCVDAELARAACRCRGAGTASRRPRSARSRPTAGEHDRPDRRAGADPAESRSRRAWAAAAEDAKYSAAATNARSKTTSPMMRHRGRGVRRLDPPARPTTSTRIVARPPNASPNSDRRRGRPHPPAATSSATVPVRRHRSRRPSRRWTSAVDGGTSAWPQRLGDRVELPATIRRAPPGSRSSSRRWRRAPVAAERAPARSRPRRAPATSSSRLSPTCERLARRLTPASASAAAKIAGAGFRAPTSAEVTTPSSSGARPDAAPAPRAARRPSC